MRHALWIVMALTTSLIVQAARAEPSLSNDDAKRVIEAFWKKQVLVVSLGPFDIVRDGMSGGIPMSVFKSFYVPLAEAGAIQITETQSSTTFNQGQSFSWDQLLGQSVGGVAMRVVISATPAGQLQNRATGEESLSFGIGEQRIERVVDNQPARRGIDDYRIVRVLFTVSWNEYVKVANAICGRTPTSAQQGVVLLKFDPFSDGWTYVTEDGANAGTEFCTTFVADALK